MYIISKYLCNISKIFLKLLHFVNNIKNSKTPYEIIEFLKHFKEIYERLSWRNQIEKNTNILKISFQDRFDIIDEYEKAISLLEGEKKDLMSTNCDILKMRETLNRKLVEQFNEIQENNNR